VKDLRIRLYTFEDVKDFVYIVSRYGGKAELWSDTYQIDAKSFLGVASLDLTKPFSLHLDQKDGKTDEMTVHALSRYLIGA
jgi:phosphotransferase system HPr-like phosphotransfer protein